MKRLKTSKKKFSLLKVVHFNLQNQKSDVYFRHSEPEFYFRIFEGFRIKWNFCVSITGKF